MTRDIRSGVRGGPRYVVTLCVRDVVSFRVKNEVDCVWSLRVRAGIRCGVRLRVREFDLLGFRNGIASRVSDHGCDEAPGWDGAR